MSMGWTVIDGDGEKADICIAQKAFIFLKRNLVRLLNSSSILQMRLVVVHNVIMGATVSCTFSASCR